MCHIEHLSHTVVNSGDLLQLEIALFQWTNSLLHLGGSDVNELG